MDFKFKKIKISIIYMFIFVLKNFLIYLLLNLIAIPFYLTLPGLNILIFLIINGYILGIQTYKDNLSYFDQFKTKKLIAQNKLELCIIGTFLTLIYLIPLINFLHLYLRF